ncbi:transmembrane protein, putative (macronuclear) [Tetrahymena thermophila SB210]|uniref:Transmembrane protein, putative n=1 Tax=Tetrahymena thermophila (strain SB210) TaxID=312017 RepID=I7M7W8_TETTS|nr:transmembrane protein, putative [Tetrahymena thermophila SB210]EAR96152.1 transmembrane protein, putative [Tetrahymena thermophila SB210]|eukprot:XP_001016397.1 transmembrane protein, putative [Tetrahymena thermophila SB210]
MNKLQQIQFKFDDRGLMMLNQVSIFVVTFVSLGYGLIVYFHFLACNCLNIQIPGLQEKIEQKIQQYGLAAIAQMVFDLITIPLILYNLSRLLYRKQIHIFFEIIFVIALFMRILAGSLIYYFNLQKDELSYISFITFQDYCSSFLNITQDLCNVLESINSYSNSNLSLVSLSTLNLLFFLIFYHINYKETKAKHKDLELEMQEEKNS